MSCTQSGEITFKRLFFEVSHVRDKLGRIAHAGNRYLRAL